MASPGVLAVYCLIPDSWRSLGWLREFGVAESARLHRVLHMEGFRSGFILAGRSSLLGHICGVLDAGPGGWTNPLKLILHSRTLTFSDLASRAFPILRGLTFANDSTNANK